jgi:AcrR family transcriptional regulator
VFLNASNELKVMSKKDLILDVAESLFNRLGYTAVGVDMIRDEAGVSKTSMYRHFGSKTKLIESVLARRHQRFEESLAACVAEAHSSREKLSVLLDWHFNWFAQDDFKGCMFMHALAEFKESESEIAHLSQKHKTWIKSLLDQVISSSSNDDVRSEMMMVFLEGLIVRSEFERLEADKDHYHKTWLMLAEY